MIDENSTEPHLKYWRGRVEVTYVCVPSRSRISPPAYVLVQTRIGEDNQYLTTELTWEETRSLQQRLNAIVKERDKYERKLAKAAKRDS